MYSTDQTPVPKSKDTDESSDDGSNGNGNGNGKGLDAANQPGAKVIFEVEATCKVSGDISLIQHDIQSFILIFAKHLSRDNQPLDVAITETLERDDEVIFTTCYDVYQLTDNIFQALKIVMPKLQRITVNGVVQGIVEQIKDVAERCRAIQDDSIV